MIPIALVPTLSKATIERIGLGDQQALFVRIMVAVMKNSFTGSLYVYADQSKCLQCFAVIPKVTYVLFCLRLLRQSGDL